MSQKLKYIFSYLVFFFLSLLIAWPFLMGLLLKTHDGIYQFIKTVSMYQSWSYGDFIGRWTPNINHGYGYGMFNFYGPLFFYFSAAVNFIIHNLIWAHNLAIVAVYLGSGWAMYLLAKDYWGRTGAILSTLAYLFAPFHLEDLYIRSSCGELVAMLFMPLALWAVQRLAKAFEWKYFYMSVFFLAALFVSHNITLMLFMPVYFVFVFCLWWKINAFDLKKGMMYLSVGILGAMLSAYFWVPAILEKGSVQLDRNISSYFYYHDHFVFLDQLFWGAWGNGSSVKGHEDGMTFMIGMVHLFLFFWLCFNFKKLKSQLNKMLVLWWIIAFLLTVFMTLAISDVVWKNLPLLQFAQFPWRILNISVLIISLTVGGVITLIKTAQRQKMALIICGFLMVAANVAYCRPFGYVDLKNIGDVGKFLYFSDPLDNMEYMPIQLKQFTFLPTDPNRLVNVNGQGKVIDYKRETPLRHAYRYLALTPSTLLFQNFYLPGWTITIDGVETPFVDNPIGEIMFNVPAGEHALRIYFADTVVRFWSNMLSLLAFGLLMGLGLIMWLKGRYRVSH